jgi:DNA-binding LacI/PurR family transcriptional regulator
LPELAQDTGAGTDDRVRDFSESGGVAAMKTLLERDTDLDAVFAASDLMAAGWPSC